MTGPRKILLIQGHPDPAGEHFCHALASRYADAARRAGHQVQTVSVAALDFPLLRTRQDWDQGTVPPSLAAAQISIRWADHIVIVFPLWLGGLPALLKAFLEQVIRPGFALSRSDGARGFPKKLLAGRSARLIVTMGMPAVVYRWYFRGHSVKALERNILGFVGISPVDETLIGQVEGDAGAREDWLSRMDKLGAKSK